MCMYDYAFMIYSPWLNIQMKVLASLFLAPTKSHGRLAKLDTISSFLLHTLLIKKALSNLHQAQLFPQLDHNIN